MNQDQEYDAGWYARKAGVPYDPDATAMWRAGWLDRVELETERKLQNKEMQHADSTRTAA